MADALGAEEVERVPDRLGAGRLARVRHAVQPGGAGLREVRRRTARADADLGAAEAEADQPVRALLRATSSVTSAAGDAGLAGDVEAPGAAARRSRARPGARASSTASQNASAGDAPHDRGVRGQGQLGVADVLRGQLAGDLVGQRPDVLGVADQVDDREVDLDEVARSR